MDRCPSLGLAPRRRRRSAFPHTVFCSYRLASDAGPSPQQSARRHRSDKTATVVELLIGAERSGSTIGCEKPSKPSCNVFRMLLPQRFQLRTLIGNVVSVALQHLDQDFQAFDICQSLVWFS